MKNAKRLERVTVWLFFAVLIAAFLCFALRISTRIVLVDRLHEDNAFTKTVLGDPAELPSFQGYRNLIETYATEEMIGYDEYVAAASRYNRLVRWNVAEFGGYNAVVQLADGTYTLLCPRLDVNENIAAMAGLKSYTDELGIPLLYVQTPFKVCREDVESGTLDFSNQRADDLLRGLADHGIPALDLREELHRADPSAAFHHAAFYITDHHWKVKTGLWAARTLAEYCNGAFGFSIDLGLLDEDRFRADTYERISLGSYGTKLTEAVVEREDVTIYYPDYETSIAFSAPSKGIDLEGDFSVLLEYSQLNANAHSVYMHGLNDFALIQNRMDQDGKKVLFVSDSFAISCVPFFALGVGETLLVDLRVYTGSLRELIMREMPDLVIVMYNPDDINAIDMESGLSSFDFR